MVHHGDRAVCLLRLLSPREHPLSHPVAALHVVLRAVPHGGAGGDGAGLHGAASGQGVTEVVGDYAQCAELLILLLLLHDTHHHHVYTRLGTCTTVLYRDVYYCIAHYVYTRLGIVKHLHYNYVCV